MWGKREDASLILKLSFDFAKDASSFRSNKIRGREGGSLATKLMNAPLKREAILRASHESKHTTHNYQYKKLIKKQLECLDLSGQEKIQKTSRLFLLWF